jgi:ATP-dependent protease ClpP protease subunit
MQVSQQLPLVVYGTFCDDINQESAHRIMTNFAGAYQRGVRELHLFFNSSGGIVTDGVGLYNYFLSLPFELHIYNPSAVDSAAMIPLSYQVPATG